MIPLVIYTCLIAELTLTTGRTSLVRFFLSAGWRYAAEMSFLALLCAECSVSSPLSLCCFQRLCPLSCYTKGMFKAVVWGTGSRCSLRGRSRKTTQPCQVGYLSHRRCLMTESWRRPKQQVMPRRDPGRSQPETHTSIRFVEEGCQRAFGLGPLLFWDRTLFPIGRFETRAWSGGNGPISSSI